MSTTYHWYSPAPDLYGNVVCQSLDHWEYALADVITYCRENLDARVVIDEYRTVFTGRKFLEAIGVEEGDGEGFKLCEECREPAVLPPHKESGFAVYYSRWCAEHAKDVA